MNHLLHQFLSIIVGVQEASLNPVSPEFVPRKMQPSSGFDGENDGNEADWQQSKLQTFTQHKIV